MIPIEYELAEQLSETDNVKDFADAKKRKKMFNELFKCIYKMRA